MANTQPHIHQLVIKDRHEYWSIEYGDQTMQPGKWWPWLPFLSRTWILKHSVKTIIRRHDKGSETVAKTNTAMEEAMTLQPKLPDQWGSRQLQNQ